MNLIEIIISIVIVGILAVSLVVTWAEARRQKVAEGHYDAKIGEPVQRNVYSRNPVFLAYTIFFALLLAIVLFVAITFF